jgi:nucleotide-binding universal stress UspA family protein
MKQEKDKTMRQILVAIDFSKHSVKALEFAIVIANVVSAQIMMVWVDKPESEDSIFDNTSHEHRQEAKQRLEELIKKYSKQLKKGKLTYKLRKGKVYKEVANQAHYNDAYLIIAGSHGVSGFESFWIGSNANKIVAYSPCPVITMRDTFPLKKTIKKVILPIDNSMSTRQKVPFAMEFAKCFCSEIHVLELQSSSLKTIRSKVSSYTAQVSKFLKENGVNHVVKSVDADNITSATIKYAEQIDADLIIIMTEQEEELSNIWLGPYAQQMVNNSPIPVMSVHPKEIEYLAK